MLGVVDKVEVLMSKYGMIVVISLALVAPVLADDLEAKSDLVGSYTNGEATLTFFANGTSALVLNEYDAVTVLGSFTASDGVVKAIAESGPMACPGPAEYRYELGNDELRYTLVSDDCEGRRNSLDGSVWTKVALPFDGAE